VWEDTCHLLNRKPTTGRNTDQWCDQRWNHGDVDCTYVLQAASVSLNIRGRISWMVISKASGLLHAKVLKGDTRYTMKACDCHKQLRRVMVIQQVLKATTKAWVKVVKYY
jgi:hypothetical protein